MDDSIIETMDPPPFAIGWMISMYSAIGETDQAIELAEFLVDVSRGEVSIDELDKKYVPPSA